MGEKKEKQRIFEVVYLRKPGGFLKHPFSHERKTLYF